MFAGKSKPTSEIKDVAFENSFPCYGGNGIRGYVDTYSYDGIYSIVGRQGALCGNVNIATGKFYATEHAVVVTLFNGIEFLWSNYILHGLKLNNYATGAAQAGLSVANVLNVLVAIPPRSEQIKISKQIEYTLKYIDSIKKNEDGLHLVVESIKSKILDLAIRGKLVPQDPNDEPASVLLERIKAEKEELIKQGKIKRDKKESVIFKGEDNSYYEKIGSEIKNISDEIPFDIPDSWSWCRGYSCFAGMNSTKPTGDFFRYIDIDSIDNKIQKIRDAKTVPTNKAPSRASRDVENGSVLFSFVRPYLKNIAPVSKEYSDCIASTGFYVCNSNGTLDSKFMYYLMISDYVVKGLNQFMKGDNSPSITKDNIEGWLYPIPPLMEQKEICEKISALYTEVREIEKSLN